ncbi:MAG: HD domain-containing protein [Candidatus Margulisbacteria bacterium]|jgi:predicted hydrolase (HD superfamily)|nr:HD domain-containing protein [Candidatus Margulisiibacteriota bacterium]
MLFSDAQKLLDKYVKGETLRRHCLTVAVALEYWARSLGEPEPESWKSLGLLHDIDFELYPDEHCVKAREIFEAEKNNFPEITEELIRAVQSHGWNIVNDVKPETRLEKALYAVDELTGLIFACAMVRPSKSVLDLEVKSILKKFKSPAFAANCSRSVITAGAELLGMELKDVIEKTLLAMRSQAQLLGV